MKPTVREAIKEIQLRVIQAMLDGNSSSDFGDDTFYPFRWIRGETGIPIEFIRAALRTMREKGLVAFSNTLWSADGEVAGSGYGVTREGRAWFERGGVDAATDNKTEER